MLREIARRDATLTRYRDELRKVESDSYRECHRLLAEARSLVATLTALTYDQLFPAAMVSKTDADGRFRFECPLGQTYVVLARGQRELFSGKIENYEWILAAEASETERQPLLLTNDNLVESQSPDNLLRDVVSVITSIEQQVPASQSKDLPKEEPLPREPRWAPDGTYHLLAYRSVMTNEGVIGLPPGTRVVAVEEKAESVIVAADSLKFEVLRKLLTDNLELADAARSSDDVAQHQVGRWQAVQEQLNRENTDEENRRDDEAQRIIEENYKRIHTLTGESALNRRPY